MSWVWTDEIVAAVSDVAQVDPGLVYDLTARPIAIRAKPGEHPDEVAERLGLLTKSAVEGLVEAAE